jgi:hypothetical protein
MSFTESPVYSYNRGHLWMGDAVAGGMPTSFPVDIAALDSFEVTLSPEYVEHMNKQSAVALKDVKALSGMSASGKITVLTATAGHADQMALWLEYDHRGRCILSDGRSKESGCCRRHPAGRRCKDKSLVGRHHRLGRLARNGNTRHRL